MNFDKIINRTDTNCYKWDIPEVKDDVISLWVADMDFQVPTGIIKHLHKRVEHGIFGYSFPSENYFTSFINWQKKRHNWEIKKENLIFSPGIVPAIILAITSLTGIGDNILIQTPVYKPFFEAVSSHKRNLIENKLVYQDNYYTIDFEKLEDDLSKNVKMMIFCSPHNPIGRVWKPFELEKILFLCRKYKVILISDEIHSDFIFSGNKHIPISKFSNDNDKIITLMSPSKTFNIAGLRSSIGIIKNKEILEKYRSEFFKYDLYLGNVFGYVAFEAAYNFGEKWLDELLIYLENNANIVRTFFKENFHRIKVTKSEGTFLLWINFESLGLNGIELQEFFLKKAGVLMDAGSKYGGNGGTFLRMNIGTSKINIKESLMRIKKSIELLEVK